MFLFALSLVLTNCSTAQTDCTKEYAKSIGELVNSGITMFITLKINSEKKSTYVFLRTLDLYAELYQDLKYDEEFDEIIHEILLKKEIDLSHKDYVALLEYEVDKSELSPKEVILKYFDSSGVAKSDSFAHKDLYTGLSVLASDCIVIYEEIEGPEINMDYAKKKYQIN